MTSLLKNAFRLLILTALTIGSGAALADAPQPSSSGFNAADFNTVITEPSLQQQEITAAKQSPVWARNPCPAAAFTLSTHLGIFQPPRFDQNHKMTEGAWTQPVTVHGCDADLQLNVLVIVHDGAMRQIPVMPGTTIADPRLQRDAVKYAIVAAGPAKDCTDGYFADTKFLGNDPAAARANHTPWQEEWTVVECGARSVVTLHFTPDATGTVISASPGETRRLPSPGR